MGYSTEPVEPQPIRRLNLDKLGWDGRRTKWETSGLLIAAKIAAWLFAKERIGDDQAILNSGGRWAKKGVNAASTYEVVVRLFPDFPAEALAVLGHSEDVLPDRLSNRLYYMFHEKETKAEAKKNNRPPNKDGEPKQKNIRRISVEHPGTSRRLVPFVPLVERLFAARKPTTKETLEAMMAEALDNYRRNA